MKHNKSYHSLERLPFEIRVSALVTYSASPECTAHIMWLITAGIPIIFLYSAMCSGLIDPRYLDVFDKVNFWLDLRSYLQAAETSW